jgi:predicted phosphodiesterase
MPTVHPDNPLPAFHKEEVTGPFDLVGDVHGCFPELMELLQKLGWAVQKNVETGHFHIWHPAGRRAVFVGDYVDRGPDSPQVLRLVMDMVAGGTALAVPGNHDMKLQRWLEGRPVQMTHGLQSTADQLAEWPDRFKEEILTFIEGLPIYLILDSGHLVVAHAGIPELYIGHYSKEVRHFCLYGDTTGEKDEYGLPVRLNWAADYRGKAAVVYGHTPARQAHWQHNTICIDTGCVYGGALTALRYPELELVSVAAHRQYYAPVRPIPEAAGTPLLTD